MDSIEKFIDALVESDQYDEQTFYVLRAYYIRSHNTAPYRLTYNELVYHAPDIKKAVYLLKSSYQSFSWVEHLLGGYFEPGVKIDAAVNYMWDWVLKHATADFEKQYVYFEYVSSFDGVDVDRDRLYARMRKWAAENEPTSAD